MLNRLYFVRHAHSTYTPDELGRPLSERGMADADKVSRLLKRESIDVVLSSPYKRAIQTVQGIANVINKEIEIENDFRERKISQIPVGDFSSAIRKLWKYPRFSFPGGESNVMAQKRGWMLHLK